ncbi:MAG: tRNA dihydrouridine synthase DusB [Acidimicrobiia bacterium]
MTGPPALALGRLRVDPPVVLAPMAGVTNAAFRSLCRTYGGGLYVSEMVMARALVEDNARTRRMVRFGADETVRSVQLCGVDPAVVSAAVRCLVDEVGVDHVDLNFGCPAGKVTRKGGGAALPAHPRLFASIVGAAVRAAGEVPVTVKLRLGIDDARPTATASALAAEAAGAAGVTLHARTAEQLYAGRADWEAIARLKAAVRTIPVLGNGDVWEADDAVRMLAETGCDGVVVGRGCLGRPWLFGELSAALAGRPVPGPPDLREVVAVMGRHAAALAEVLGETRAVLDFRKHAGWYLAGFPVGRAIRARLASAGTLAELAGWLAEVAGLGLPPAPPVPRGPVHGPRRVALPDGWMETADDPSPPVGAEAFVSGG